MAQKKLTQLPKTQFSGLEFSNILEDVYNLVRENPDYNQNWNDFLASDAGVMLTEIYAWITDQLATRIDWVVNENFIGTATQRSSIINLLKLIGYKFLLPVASEVPVSVSFGVANGDYYLTPAYDPSIGVFNAKSITAKDKKGKTKFFEAIQYDSETKEFGYKLPVYVNTNDSLEHIVNFYEGSTKIENFDSTNGQGQIFTLSENPVIRNSIKVYLVEVNGGTGVVTEHELLEVDSFLSLKAQKKTNDDGSENPIPYVLNVLEYDVVEVTFGTSTLLPDADRRLPEGSKIRVFYRVGGGLDGNISRGSIDLKEDILNNGISTDVRYKNNSEGIGGEDSETVEHAAYAGPLKIKTVGKTVTEEDYDIIISNFINILISKSYGHNNLPIDFYEKYGYYPTPVEVLNFIVMKKSGWDSIPTYKYKYANWGTLNLENYFNEPLAFTDGSFGEEVMFNEQNNNSLTLEQLYEVDMGAGKIFYNFKVLSTPQDWKDNIFIEDPNNTLVYIANPDAKASLTETKYDENVHLKLEDIPNHFVANTNDPDPYFYGDYKGSGAPRQELEEDINAYFQSERNNFSGVWIGTDSANDKNLLNINIDGHGDVTIDLSIGGVNSGSVPLDGTNGIIEVINNAFASAYNNVYSYQDFGVLIPDTTQPITTIDNKDGEIWVLNVNGTNVDINLGDEQTYDANLIQINLGLGAYGHQDFYDNGTSDWTVTNGTQYDFNIDINGTGNTLITLAAMTGTTLSAAQLIAMLNDAFTSATIDAFASIEGTAVRVSTTATGNSATVSITSGGANDLLAVTGAMQTAVAGGDIEAFFVQSQANGACKDVRISRTNTTTGDIVLADSGTVVDILDAYGALPINTSPVAHGDYSNVASIFTRGTTEKYIKLTSPNAGPNSIIMIKEPTVGSSRDATNEALGLKFSDYGVTTLNNYGQRRLTIITRNSAEDDFGDFIYEHGSLIINKEDLEIIYLNYLKSKKETIRLGNYYTENFTESDPEWKHSALRLYNTTYKSTEDPNNPLEEEIDYELSKFILKFTRKETNLNSIFKISSDIILEETTEPTITSVDLTSFPSVSGKFIKISINENPFIKVPTDTATTIDSLIALLNTNWGDQAKEKAIDENLIFATRENNKIILKIGDKTKTGNITIYDDETNLIGSTVFATPVGENTKIMPDGDYYLEHYTPAPDPNLTPEEKFGYFTINIIKEKSDNIPDLKFMSHLVNDRRHKFLDETVYRLRTDEDDLKEALYPYKIVGIENTFQTPIFSTFDVEAEIFIEVSASAEQIKQKVESALRDFYSLEKSNLGLDINKSEIIGIVLKIDGVRFMDISYFGKDYTDQTGYGVNQINRIVVDFDEICVLSDNIYDDDGAQTNGLLLKYTSL